MLGGRACVCFVSAPRSFPLFKKSYVLTASFTSATHKRLPQILVIENHIPSFILYYSIGLGNLYLRWSTRSEQSSLDATGQADKIFRLGQSGLKFSKVILGAKSYGLSESQDGVVDEAEELPLLKHACDVGLNTWDTADVYSHGRSEEIIAKAIEKYHIPRQDLVILSKCYFGVAQDGSQPRTAARSTNDGEMVN